MQDGRPAISPCLADCVVDKYHVKTTLRGIGRG
jgi:hypothetical protein